MAYKYVVNIKTDTLDALKQAIKAANDAIESFALSDEGLSGRNYNLLITSDRIN